MKTSTLALLAVIGVASAGKPQLSVKVSDGQFAGLNGLDPTITWSGTSKTGEVDLEYGIESSAAPTADIASLPRKIWGIASTDVGGWATSVRADVDPAEPDSADLEIDAVNGDLSVKVIASAGKGFSVSSVEATQEFDSGDARVSVTPRYNVESEEADVVLGYDVGDTNIEVTASADAQSITISQQIDEDNRIAPTLASNGDISLEWERSLGGDDSLTTTVKPNDSVDIEWKDADWTANVNLPLDGTSVSGANVGIKRTVDF